MIAPITTEGFKAVMRRWPTGVAIVSTEYNERLYGLTVNSFTSVSLDPPLISFCLNKNSGSFEGFDSASDFTINILSDNQQDIAKRFAIKNADKFSGIDYRISEGFSGILIDGAHCVLSCLKVYKYDAGDHVILVAKVKYCSANNDLKPLIYLDREYIKI